MKQQNKKTEINKLGFCDDCGNETHQCELNENRGMCIICNDDQLQLEADQRDEW